MADTLEQRARDLLAAEYRTDHHSHIADAIERLDSHRLDAAHQRSIRAITAALQAQQPVTPLPAAEINALPEHVRKYIMWLETDADPAGTLRENFRLNEENAALRVLVSEPEAQQPGAQAVAERTAPVQGFSAGIPWSLHLEAYDAYSKKWAPQQALIEGGCRGGFSVDELDGFIPGWRDRVSEIARLRAEVAELRKAQPPSIPEPSEDDAKAAIAARNAALSNGDAVRGMLAALTTYTARLRERIGGGA